VCSFNIVQFLGLTVINRISSRKMLVTDCIWEMLVSI